MEAIQEFIIQYIIGPIGTILAIVSLYCQKKQEAGIKQKEREREQEAEKDKLALKICEDIEYQPDKRLYRLKIINQSNCASASNLIVKLQIENSDRNEIAEFRSMQILKKDIPSVSQTDKKWKCEVLIEIDLKMIHVKHIQKIIAPFEDLKKIYKEGNLELRDLLAENMELYVLCEVKNKGTHNQYLGDWYFEHTFKGKDIREGVYVEGAERVNIVSPTSVKDLLEEQAE